MEKKENKIVTFVKRNKGKIVLISASTIIATIFGFKYGKISKSESGTMEITVPDDTVKIFLSDKATLIVNKLEDFTEEFSLVNVDDPDESVILKAISGTYSWK